MREKRYVTCQREGNETIRCWGMGGVKTKLVPQIIRNYDNEAAINKGGEKRLRRQLVGKDA